MSSSCIAPDWQPIVAQCTPQGSGAIALIRISGKRSRELIASCVKLSSQRSITEVLTHTINHGWVVDSEKEILDEVLFLIMDGPRSFTGEDSIEITCHNNQFIIQSIISRICSLGARPAERGEFTRRAYQNKKIDLLQAEAIADIIHAQSESALKASLAQLRGSLSHSINELENEICRIAAWCQASFEFLDDEGDFKKQMYEMSEKVLHVLELMITSCDQQRYIREGVRISLIGSVNTGKSSLFNCLIKRDRSIVTDIPGTTRDSVEAHMHINGKHFTLIDTAGIRMSNDIVEQEGIRRSYEEAEKSDIILLIYDGSRLLNSKEHEIYDAVRAKYHEKIISIVNKVDKDVVFDAVDNCSMVSSASKQGMEELLKKIDERAIEIMGKTSPFLLNARHHQLLTTIHQGIVNILKMLAAKTVHYELILTHLHDILAQCADVTGKTVSERSMDLVFREFCVGK